MFDWLGLIVNVLIWLGLVVLLTRWRSKQLGSISAHGASAKGAALLFQIILVGGGALIYWWLLGWFIPQLRLPTAFTVILTIVVAYQVVTGFVNGAGVVSKEIHDYTAKTMALLYLPLAVLILVSPRIGLAAQIVGSILFVYMVNSYVVVEVLRKFRGVYLIFQTAYIVAFQLLILAAAYLPR